MNYERTTCLIKKIKSVIPTSQGILLSFNSAISKKIKFQFYSNVIIFFFSLLQNYLYISKYQLTFLMKKVDKAVTINITENMIREKTRLASIENYTISYERLD